MAVSSVSVSNPSVANSATAGISKTGSGISSKTQLNMVSSILTQDVIDSLKEADESVQIKPLTTRMEQNKTKQGDITAITTLLSQLKSSYAGIANETALLARSTTQSGTGSVSASVEAGVKEQTIRLSVSQLAQVDSYQSKGFDSRSAVLDSSISGEQTINLKVGDKSFDIKITNTTTLEDINDQINDKSGGKMTSSIINTGGENGYRLVFQTTNSGASNAISFSMNSNNETDTINSNLLSALGFKIDDSSIKRTENTNGTWTNTFNISTDNTSGAKQLQKAQDAIFTFNGVEITRTSNTISDLIVGATFTLNFADEKNIATGAGKESVITISKDTSGIADSLKEMVNAYNNLISNINTATSYDKDTGASGSLNGMNEITGIKRIFSDLINSMNSNGKSLQDFGFSFTDKGIMSLDENKLNSVLSSDFESFKQFFSNNTTYNNAKVFSSGSLLTNSNAISGKLIINGKELNLDINNNDATKNATDLVKAINDAGIDGVKASISASGALQISGSYGENLEIGGDSALLSQLGLKSGVTQGSVKTESGFFGKFNEAINSLIDQKNGTLTNLSTNLKDKADMISKQKARVQASLDAKYVQMQKQFARYAVQMNALSNSFNSLQTTIKALMDSGK